jgi:hypothetical protein
MPNEITIRNYDRENGLVETDGTSPFLGLDINGKHYIIGEEDYCVNSTRGRGDLVIPKTVYELVAYNERTGTAKAKEVTERSLLEKIAVEFHMQDME